MQDPINFIDPNGLRNTPADAGATAAYRDTFTKDFVPASQVIVIKPHQALMVMAALPAIGATASLAPLALPYVTSAGLYLASNPAFIGNSLDFADSLSGELGGPTTGLPSFTPDGMAGTALGMGIKQYRNSCGP